MAARKTKEWIGKTSDTNPPPRVKQRVYDRHNGICHICAIPIKPVETWHADHVKALIEGGENRENNLAPAHPHCNRKKGIEESKRKSKTNKVRQKHLGITGPKQKIKSAPFAKSKRAHEGRGSLPFKQLYE